MAKKTITLSKREMSSVMYLAGELQVPRCKILQQGAELLYVSAAFLKAGKSIHYLCGDRIIVDQTLITYSDKIIIPEVEDGIEMVLVDPSSRLKEDTGKIPDKIQMHDLEFIDRVRELSKHHNKTSQQVAKDGLASRLLNYELTKEKYEMIIV